jgi:CelD/BcsL family acetyltransferase involved in cellulose biosynthesis
VRWSLVTDSTEPDYLFCLEHAEVPMGQHALGYLRALAECPHEEPLRIVAYENGRPVGAAAGMLYSGGPARMVESLPYGYGGAITSLQGPARRECLAVLCDALVEVAKRADARLLTIQTPPFPDGPQAYREAFTPDYELRSFAQYVDLAQPLQIRRNHRRNLARAEAAGLIAECDGRPEALVRYCMLQQKRMAEVRGRARPDAFFEGIQRHMTTEGTAWLFCAVQEGVIVSATPLIGVRDVLDVLLICMDSNVSDLQPNALLCHRAMKWAVAQGFRYFNFQSSLRRGDSLYNWKLGWGAQEAPVSIMTRVLGDIDPVLHLPLAELREAYTYHYVLPYPVLDAARAGRPIDSPDLRVLDKGT